MGWSPSWARLGEALARVRDAFTLRSVDTSEFEAALLRANRLAGITPVGTSDALQVDAVAACIAAITKPFVLCPLAIYDETTRGEVEVPDHALSMVLRRKINRRRMTPAEWHQHVIPDLLIYGRHYSQITTDPRGNVTELFPLVASQMQVSEAREEGARLDPNGRITDDRVFKYKGVEVDSEKILEINYGIAGRSMFDLARNTCGLTITAEQIAARVLASGGGEMQPVILVPNLISPKIQTEIEESYSGSRKKGRIPILAGGATLKDSSKSSSELQLLETREALTRRIAMIFGVPPHVLGFLDRATHSNIEAEAINYNTYGWGALAVAIQQALTTQLLGPKEESWRKIKYKVEGILRGDFKTRVDAATRLMVCGAWNQNEVRAVTGQPSVPDGDKFVIQGAMVPLDSLQKKEDPQNAA